MTQGHRPDPELDGRLRAYRWGLSAEVFASLYLRLKGYRILERRYRSPVGEIDLIARRGRLIAFVEVKARGTRVDALDSVGARTQRRIIATADHWGARHPPFADFTWRYDIIAVVPRRLPHHVRGAFRPDI